MTQFSFFFHRVVEFHYPSCAFLSPLPDIKKPVEWLTTCDALLQI